MTNLRVNPWGEHIQLLRDREATTRLLNKIANPKQAKSSSDITKRLLAADALPIQEKLKIIRENVIKLLGHYAPDVALITTKNDLHSYIDKAINNGIISIDTETYGTTSRKDDALDTLTCKLAGLCLYTPGEKAVYIPVNHLDCTTNNKLINQLDESEIKDECDRLSNTKIIMHNGSFDYRVIKCTCNSELDIYWDTQAVACLLDENEDHSLKEQYRLKIDNTAKDYSFGKLFGKVGAAYIQPDVFVLYAAIDALLTYKLYEYQYAIMSRPDMSDVMKLYEVCERPLIKVAANMELRGINLDEEYARLLSIKYHKKLDKETDNVLKELNFLKDKIAKWRTSEDANTKPKNYLSTDSAQYDVPKETDLVDENGKYYRLGKSKAEQLSDPINIDSPMQLSILVYDILKAKAVNKKKPRAVGKTELAILAETYPICAAIAKRREVQKLTKDFIDTLPAELNPKDNKIHTSFNPLGTVTGRFSCSNPNLQQIPSNDPSIRLMFKAGVYYKDIEILNNECYAVAKTDQVNVFADIWKRCSELKIGDTIVNSEGTVDTIKNISTDKDFYYLYV